MNRPTRQRTHLLEKITEKEARAQSVGRKPGKRIKRWKKWTEAYKATAGGASEG
jgi:hypothetical protein